MPGPTQALSPNGENNNDIIPDNNGSNIIPYRKNTVRGERAYRYTTAITIRRPLYKENPLKTSYYQCIQPKTTRSLV